MSLNVELNKISSELNQMTPPSKHLNRICIFSSDVNLAIKNTP